MFFLFLDESGDTKKPSDEKDCNNPGRFFALGGLLIHEDHIRKVENFLEKTKKQMFGDEKYQTHHPELKAKELFSRGYINKKQRQNSAHLISSKLEFFFNKEMIYTFGILFDKRKASIYDETNDRHEIDMWFYNLGIQKLLTPIYHCLETVFDKARCMIIIDRMFAEKAFSETIVTYFCGNPYGKKMDNMHRHALFGESKDSPMLQLADFIIGTLRFWEEYEDDNFYEKRKLKKSKLTHANSKIRKSAYYASGNDTSRPFRGIFQAYE